MENDTYETSLFTIRDNTQGTYLEGTECSCKLSPTHLENGQDERFDSIRVTSFAMTNDEDTVTISAGGDTRIFTNANQPEDDVVYKFSGEHVEIEFSAEDGGDGVLR